MKNSHRFKLIAVILIVISILSCNKGFEDCHESMYLENNSSSAIYYASTLKDGFLNYDPSNPVHASDYKIDTGKTQKIRIGISLSCWEQVMKSADGYVYIYVYDAVELETGGWNKIKDKPLKKYTLTAKQLNQMKWKIVYP